MSENSNNLNEVKLVIAGLDNAGKTSFLIALRQKYNFYERVANLKPTIKIDYSSFTFLNFFRVNIWDMGGQAKYRNIYINNPIYFSETNYLYYLIDIQDEMKFQESIHYLHELLNIYRDMEYKNEVIVCFTKFDPKFKNNDEFNDRVEMIKNLILTQNQDMNFKFFQTSYYDISSLSRAVSYSLNKLLNLEQINATLKKLVEEIGCTHCILYTSAGLIISDYYKETMDSREFEEQIFSRINDNLEFFQRLVDEKVDINERLSFCKNSTEYVKRYELKSQNGSNIFYLEVSAPPKKLNEVKSELSAIENDLENILK